jgi:hypothetical protein
MSAPSNRSKTVLRTTRGWHVCRANSKNIASPWSMVLSGKVYRDPILEWCRGTIPAGTYKRVTAAIWEFETIESAVLFQMVWG